MKGVLLFLAVATAASTPPKHTYVLVGDVAIGEFAGGKWRSSDDTWFERKAPEAVRVVGLGKLGTQYSLHRFSAYEPRGVGAETNGPGEASTKDDDFLPVLVTASSVTIPRPVQVIDARSAIYRKVVADFVRSKGIRNPKVVFTAIARADLDGDGKAEVVISAMSRPKLWAGGLSRNDYSAVLVRWLDKSDKPHISVAQFERYKDNDWRAYIEVLGAIADLDGDGVMEVVTGGRYVEGWFGSVYRFRAGKIEDLAAAEAGA